MCVSVGAGVERRGEGTLGSPFALICSHGQERPGSDGFVVSPDGDGGRPKGPLPATTPLPPLQHGEPVAGASTKIWCCKCACEGIKSRSDPYLHCLIIACGGDMFAVR